jgi:hypothetical protein
MLDGLRHVVVAFVLGGLASGGVSLLFYALAVAVGRQRRKKQQSYVWDAAEMLGDGLRKDGGP